MFVALLAVALSLASAQAVPQRACHRAPTLDDPQMWSLNIPDCYQQDNFGEAVAISPDGSTTVVSSLTWPDSMWWENDKAPVYVYTRNATGWNLTFEIVEPVDPDNGQMDYFGSSVAISSVASSILIGACNANVSGTYRQGALYAYNAVDGRFEQYMTASDGQTYDVLGTAVAAAAYAPYALAAAIGFNYNQGAVYALTFDAQSRRWNITQKLVATNGQPPDNFGHSIALNVNGSFAVIGASLGAGGMGAVYTFIHGADGVWRQEAELTQPPSPRPSPLACYGWSVSGSDDYVIVGANGASAEGQMYVGLVFVYTRDRAGQWNLTQTLEVPIANASATMGFGAAVTISANGHVVVVGAPNSAVNGVDSAGTVYVFALNTSTLVWEQQLVATPPAGDQYMVELGTDVAVSANGSVLIAGAPKTDVGVCGNAYVIAWQPPLSDE